MVFGGREGEVKGLVEALVQEELCQELHGVEVELREPAI